MRIAYLSTFYPFRGGISQFNTSLFRAFEKKHFIKAYTFTTQYPNFLFPGDTQFVTKADEVDKIESQRILSTVNPFSYITTAKKIKNFNPDIILMKYWMSFFGPSLGTVCKLQNKNTKCISILDNVISHEKKFFDTAFTKYFLKQNNGFVVMSKKVQEDLLSLQINAKYILLEHPFYDHFGDKINKENACRKLNIDASKKTILFFGFIRNYKGLDLLIEAMKYLDDSYQLIIAGETYGSFQKYTDLIENNPQKSNIHVFNKYIKDSEVAQFFSASDVCVLPYKSATQSGITSISHYFEIPMIATAVGGLQEFILHNINGLIVNNISSNGIAYQIETYFSNNLKNKFEKELTKMKAIKTWSYFADEIIKFSKTL